MAEILNDKIKQTFVLRFDPGEEAISEIVKFCKENRITAGWVTMLGACKEVELWYYCIEPKKYQKQTFTADLEVLVATGNIGLLNNEVMIHTHGSFSNDKYEVIGGHINKLVVSATLEVRIDVYEGDIGRKFNEQIGLNLMTK